MKTTFSAERRMDVAPDVVYHCIADYEEHHRPGGFLPPSFSDFAIVHGGIGAGSELTWVVEAGGNKRKIDAVVSEPQPGRVLVETSPAIVTTFTVEPVDGGSLVRFDTEIDEGGVKGVMNRLFAPRMLVPIYRDELERLEAYARAHGPVPG
jgi:polyketide cyclase/dehydrase/lipid transport protein